MKIRKLAGVIAVALMSSTVMANEAAVYSEGGDLLAEYETFADAIDAVQDGEMIKLLSKVTLASKITLTKSITIDLNKTELGEDAGRIVNSDWLLTTAGVEFTIRNGTLSGGWGLCLAEGSAVHIRDCSIWASCLTGGGAGTIWLEEGSMTYCDYIGASTDFATVNACDGHLFANSKNWRYDEKGFGTIINILGGRTSINPLESPDIVNLADERIVIYSVDMTWGVYCNYRIVTKDEAAGLVEAIYNGIGYATLGDAIQAAEEGDTVTLLHDINHEVDVRKSVTLDLGGHTICREADGDVVSISNGAHINLRNGTVRQIHSGRCCFILYDGALLDMDETVTLGGSDNFEDWTCGFYIPGDGPVSLIIDGTDIQTHFIFSAAWLADTRVTFIGDGKILSEGIPYWGAAEAPKDNLVIAGGWWQTDPSGYLVEGVKMRDYGADYAASGYPCRYRAWVPDPGMIVIVR